MVNPEQSVKFQNGLDIYRPVPYEDVAAMLGPLTSPIDFTGNEHIELHSPDDPENCPAVNILPRGWFKYWLSPPGLSVANLQEHMVDNCPSLTQPLDVPVRLSIYSGKRLRFIIATPTEGALLNEERSSILKTVSKIFKKADGQPKKNYMDITLAFINAEIEGHRMYELKKCVQGVPQQIIRLDPLRVKLGSARDTPR